MSNWIDIGSIHDIPRQGARTVKLSSGEIGVFRTQDDQLFALENRCPHKHGPLSQGIIHGHAVACPLHNWRISLATGQALGDDRGCVPVVPMKVDGERILIQLTLPEARAA